MKFLILAALLVVSPLLPAETFRCEVDGKLIFRDRPGERCVPITVKVIQSSPEETARQLQKWEQAKAEETRKAAMKQAAANRAKSTAAQRQPRKQSEMP